MELFDNVTINTFHYYLYVHLCPPFFSQSRFSIFCDCLYNTCRFGSSPLVLSAFICCLKPSQTACAPPFLYQWDTAPLQSLHHEYLRSSLLLVKHYWRKDQEQRKSSCFLRQRHCGRFHTPFHFYNFLRRAAAMQILFCSHFRDGAYSALSLYRVSVDLHTVHKPLLGICKLKFSG